MPRGAGSRQPMRRTAKPRRTHLATLCAVGIFVVLFDQRPARGQEPPAPQAISPAQLEAAIDKLGDLDYATRTTASRTLRRTAAPQAVSALLRAVAEHADGYVRYRALVLLTGFNDPRTIDAMRESLKSPNDRLRTVAYSFFEHNSDRSMIPDLLAALDKEQAEFVRPALIRALARAAVQEPSDAIARNDTLRVAQTLVREAGRGEDFFRSAVIEALGDYKGRYAFDAITGIAKLDGPLQDDAAIALGKIGDKRALETLAALQRSAPQVRQPSVAAGICLLDVNCPSHEQYLIETLKFGDRNPGFQDLLRAAAAGLGALGLWGRTTAVDALFEVGIPARDPARSPIALALAMIAMRNTSLMMPLLETHPARDEAIALLAEGFEMLEEDLEKERFFSFARRTYWAAPEAAPARDLMQTLIGRLDF
jgi:HEAT repeat protein